MKEVEDVELVEEEVEEVKVLKKEVKKVVKVEGELGMVEFKVEEEREGEEGGGSGRA